jgi:cytochrome c-type protein NapB
MSHPHFVNCMQCHVEGRSLDLEAIAPAAPPSAGRRAWPGAPPRMPHAIAMRTNCFACHGTGGDPGLRIDHPERVSCTQCHAIAADLEMNAPFGAAAPNEPQAAER